VRRVCFKIIAEMEEDRSFSAKRQYRFQDERKNFFRIGTKNLRPKALGILIADGLVIKAPSGKYYLAKEKLAAMKKQSWQVIPF